MSTLPAYAELHCLSCFSFLRGASTPEQLLRRAHQQGYAALALTDECSVAGVVQAWKARREMAAEGLENLPQLIVGSEFRFADGLHLVLLAQNRDGYGNLCALITLARRRTPKGRYALQRGDLYPLIANGVVPGCVALWVADSQSTEDDAGWLRSRFPNRLWIAVELHADGRDNAKLTHLRALSATHKIPLVAAGDVHMHARSRRPLQDTLTAIRLHTQVGAGGTASGLRKAPLCADAGPRLCKAEEGSRREPAIFPNGERHLRHRLRLARLYPSALLAETLNIAKQCTFQLDELKYDYPEEIVPRGHTPASFLRQEVAKGLVARYPQGVPDSVSVGVEKELALIAAKRYEAFFLTVFDIVLFARSQKILCQGRGSAANSTVCYALGITAVDPTRATLLFERFISLERDEEPDIDVDFEHERREEVIQYIYKKYGRERAALAASVSSYRSKSCLRDVGKALGFAEATIDALTRSLAWWDSRDQLPERLAALDLSLDMPRVRQWLTLAAQLHGMPRHLSQHVGGFVISGGQLSRLVPVENAAMPERSVIQWDKDDLEALGLLKVDVLALGMLTVIRKALALVSIKRGREFSMVDVPPKDTATFEMISAADTVGVFQIESRAQMSMLPRLRPSNFYDLVVQVAIVRPGPIQGGMVHPYLACRRDPTQRPRITPAIDVVLARTHGVPIFQEQVMQLAVVAAGFTPGEADQLRRAMASWKQKGHVERFKQKLRAGMRAAGHPDEFAERLCRQIEGFGEYGFPESHAASFALLAYVSAWLKCHEPALFLCALLNSQPMGFYRPAQLIADARRHGVEVRPVDVQHSDVVATIEAGAVRLGFNSIVGFAGASAARIVAARVDGAFRDSADLAHRARLDAGDLRRLASADSLQALAGHRHQAAWQATGHRRVSDLLDAAPAAEAPLLLAAPSEGADILGDYASTGFTLRRHPLALLRPRLAARRFQLAAEIAALNHAAYDRAPGRAAGLVTCRQKPGTAKSVFVTLEDESGCVNVVVHPWLAERQRAELLGARLLGVYGQLQAADNVVHLVAKRLVDLTPWLGALPTLSRDFH